MKTAMQELIEELSFIEGLKDNEIDISQKSILTTATIKKSLEKEKEQIIDAFDYGYYCASNGTSAEITLDGNMYYNQSYNQNK